MDIVINKQALVFFSAGVGDSILLVPLVNELKKEGFKVTGLFTSKYDCESIFESTELFDSIVVKKNKLKLLHFSISHLKKYDNVYLNHFSYSDANISSAFLLGKHVFCNYKEPFILNKIIKPILPTENIHDALQNVFLLNKNLTLSDLNFNINYKTPNTYSYKIQSPYIIIQLSSANNKAPYKNWAIEKWIKLLEHLCISYPNFNIVLLGDNSELHLNQKINDNFKNTNIVSLIGKTTLSEVVEIMSKSQFYVGLDSGLMHIAISLNKPTFTIWGASSPILYGYEWLDSKKHKIINLNLSCSPCNAWLNANTSRVKNPLLCSDFRCVQDISVSNVISELDDFIKNTTELK